MVPTFASFLESRPTIDIERPVYVDLISIFDGMVRSLSPLSYTEVEAISNQLLNESFAPGLTPPESRELFVLTLSCIAPYLDAIREQTTDPRADLVNLKLSEYYRAFVDG